MTENTHRTALEAGLTAVAASEEGLKAWEVRDDAAALVAADQSDVRRAQGKPLSAIDGMAVGLKDVIDTVDFPTGYGSPIFATHQPKKDAEIVSRLKQAGAVVLGKTKTTEFAYMQPTSTVNPWNERHTPGGSSSGSAAAIARGHVPLALGTQTGGSVIRPASFCGVYGWKSSRGRVPREGVFRTSATLDHVGGFARDLCDLTALAGVLVQEDWTLMSAEHAPRLCWLDMPYQSEMSEGACNVFDAFLETHPQIKRRPAPTFLEGLSSAHKCVYDYEMSLEMAKLAADHWDLLSSDMQGAVVRGREISGGAYEDALEQGRLAEAALEVFFEDCDAIVSASAPGPAPHLSENTTGNAVFNATWSLLGVPCVSLPLLKSADGLPLGVQLIGAAGKDLDLFSTASTLDDRGKTQRSF